MLKNYIVKKIIQNPDPNRPLALMVTVQTFDDKLGNHHFAFLIDNESDKEQPAQKQTKTQLNKIIKREVKKFHKEWSETRKQKAVEMAPESLLGKNKFDI